MRKPTSTSPGKQLYNLASEVFVPVEPQAPCRELAEVELFQCKHESQDAAMPEHDLHATRDIVSTHA